MMQAFYLKRIKSEPHFGRRTIVVAKSLLYRLFGVGKIPATLLSQLKSEGLILWDEGIKGSVTYLDFRAPGRRASWKRQWYTTSIAITNIRLLALRNSSPIINVPLTDERIRAMRYSLEANGALCIAFDAALFHSAWSGTIEYRFRTPQAQHFLERLQKL
jgi:hypothetical protein